VAIKEKEVWVGYSGQTAKHYESKGYKFPSWIDTRGCIRVKRNTKILVKVEDLLEGSCEKVTKICDICKCEVSQSYRTIISGRNKQKNGLDKCQKCWITDLGEKSGIANKSNCVATTHPKFAKLFWNKEDTFKYKFSSNKKTDFKCPNCNSKIENKKINDIYYTGLSCYCKDGISYPQKFMFSLLKQLSVKFNTEEIFDWSQRKRYDFYLYDLNLIIEVHGIQHSKESFLNLGGRTLEEEQENDEIKKSLARENGIKDYLEIDCRKSNMDFIKKSILKSPLCQLFDLSEIDWLKCHEFALNTFVKEVCNLFNKGNSLSEVSKLIGLGRTTVYKYLIKGNEIGLCNYDSKEELKKFKILKRQVIQLSENGEFICEWDSASEASRKLGISRANIGETCRGKYKHSGGYKWMFKEEYENSIFNSLKAN
jgi:hypothetical protein